MNLPDGWVKTRDADITTMFKNVASQTGTPEQRYESGFHRSDTDPFTYPYILVQTHQVDIPSYDEIESAVSGTKTSANEVTRQLSELVTNTNITNLRLDRVHNMYSYSMVMDVQNVGKVYTTALNFFGKRSLDSVFMYDTLKDSATILEAKDAVLESFAYQTDFGYDPSQIRASNQKTVGGAAHAALSGGILGAAVGLCIGFIVTVLKNTKRKGKS